MLSRVAAVVVALPFALLPPLGCHAPRAPTPVVRHTVVQASTLTTILQFPSAYDSARTYALLVALHGFGGTALNLAPPFTSFAGESVFVALPQGEFPGPAGGSSWFYRTSDRSVWDVFDARSVASVLEMVDTLRTRYRIGKVFVLGFSQGASLAYMVGLKNPSRIAGVLAIGGYPPEIDREGSIIHGQDVAGARHLPLYIAHGTRDEAVGVRVFQAQRDYFTAEGYPVTAVEYEGGHTLTDALMAHVRQWLRAELRRE